MIIKSILDTDLYKLTMQYAVTQLYPRLKVRYKFIDRNDIFFPDNFDKDVLSEIKKMKDLSLSEDEKTFLNEKFDFLPPTYIDFLNGYRFDPDEIDIFLTKDNKLRLNIEGYWYKTILWEVPLMAIISELYFIKTGQIIDIYENEDRDLEKLNKMIEHNAYLSDFGTRRRYSFFNQNRIVKLYKERNTHIFVGTSNVYLSYLHNVGCTGTQAHEFFMVISSLFGYKLANKIALDNWVSVYNGDLGTALSDTFTTEVFFKSFDRKMSKLFDGVRHDSGDPFIFTDKVINHYKKYGIDPKSKTIIFSDGLNIDLAIEIKEYCVGKIKTSFGIGTHLTNDLGVKPLNMVIKVSEVEFDNSWHPTIKLSDNKVKHTGEKEEIDFCKRILNL